MVWLYGVNTLVGVVGICGSSLLRPDFVLLREDRFELLRSKVLSDPGDDRDFIGDSTSPLTCLGGLTFCLGRQK